MRHNKTERLGVIETDRIVTDDLDWIFREQPIVDVGVDAIIEEAKDNNPTGKFLALQIKSGKGNFHLNEKYLTYYVSNIHYHYWINLSIPIILVAHLPESKQTYWQEISEEKLKRTQKKWKLDIPLKQAFNQKAKSKLSTLLSTKNDQNFRIYQGNGSEEDIFSAIEDLPCIQESAGCLTNMSSFLRDQTNKANELTTKLKDFTKNLTPINAPQVTAAYRSFANATIVASKRIENEIEIFAELYATGVYAFERIIIIITSENLHLEDFGVDLSIIRNIPILLEEQLSAIESLRQSVMEMNLPNHHVKESKKIYLETLDLVFRETSEAKTLTEQIVNLLDNS